MSIKGKVTLIVPVYGSGFDALGFVAEYTQELSKFSDHEIIFVNDNSPDENWKQIVKCKEAYPCVKGICFTQNYGQHRAIHAGIAAGNGEYFVVADCDGQDDPKEIINFYEALKSSGKEAVLGLRLNRKDKFLKIMLSRMFYIFLKIVGNIDHDHETSSYGMVSKKVIKTYLNFNENFRTFGMILRISGYEIEKIPINHRRRVSGQSNYGFVQKVELGMDVLLANSNRPLKISIITGMVFFLFSFISVLTILYKFFILGHTEVLGWSSIVASIFLVGGVLSVSLGMVGLYIGRVYDEVKNRPFYNILIKT